MEPVVDRASCAQTGVDALEERVSRLVEPRAAYGFPKQLVVVNRFTSIVETSVRGALEVQRGEGVARQLSRLDLRESILRRRRNLKLLTSALVTSH